MYCADKLLTHATTIDKSGETQIEQAVAILNGVISWSGPMHALPKEYLQTAKEIINCNRQLLTPGLIDCHTHLVYAGDRADEFKMRMDGMSYADIARNGGGILSTVAKTRAVSEEELLQQSLPRILAMRAQGVTTVEIKSGYGLNLVSERKMLSVAKQLGKMTGMRVRTTLLAAHAVPVEFAHQQQAYVDYLCKDLFPTLTSEGLVDAIDVFCESIAFSIEQTEQLFMCAESLNLPIKCHAEQLSNIGATRLATQFKALSCDHLEFLQQEDALLMARANTVAVLLPGAYYFLRETQKPPIDLLRQAGVGMAIATDCNPGSSPTTSLLLMMNMACQLFSLTVPEVLAAVTYQAAKALGLAHHIGSLDAGMMADLVFWDVCDGAQLCYAFAVPQKHRLMIAGEWL